MRAVWKIMTRRKRVVIEREIFSKDQSLNNTRLAEEIVLLDFIQTLGNKSYKMSSRTIMISIDNNKVQLMVYRSIIVANYFNEEAAIEIGVIQRLIQQITI